MRRAHRGEKVSLQGQDGPTDREIAQRICDLYNLTDEEIAIVEACGEPFDKT